VVTDLVVKLSQVLIDLFITWISESEVSIPESVVCTNADRIAFPVDIYDISTLD